MPHFFSIALYRLADYSAASVPVFPVIFGARATKGRMLLYIFGFTAIVSLLTCQMSRTCFALSMSCAILWLSLGLLGYKAKSDILWAKSMFRLSLAVMVVLSTLIAVASRSV
jgi:protoheme IX farnesyltransferase